MAKNYAINLEASDLKYKTLKLSAFLIDRKNNTMSKEYNEIFKVLTDRGLDREFTNTYADFMQSQKFLVDNPTTAKMVATINIEEFEKAYERIPNKTGLEFEQFAMDFLNSMKACNERNIPKIEAYKKSKGLTL